MVSQHAPNIEWLFPKPPMSGGTHTAPLALDHPPLPFGRIQNLTIPKSIFTDFRATKTHS